MLVLPINVRRNIILVLMEPSMRLLAKCCTPRISDTSIEVLGSPLGLTGVLCIAYSGNFFRFDNRIFRSSKGFLLQSKIFATQCNSMRGSCGDQFRVHFRGPGFVLGPQSSKAKFRPFLGQISTYPDPPCQPDQILMIRKGLYMCPTHSTTSFIDNSHLLRAF